MHLSVLPRWFFLLLYFPMIVCTVKSTSKWTKQKKKRKSERKIWSNPQARNFQRNQFIAIDLVPIDHWLKRSHDSIFVYFAMSIVFNALAFCRKIAFYVCFFLTKTKSVISVNGMKRFDIVVLIYSTKILIRMSTSISILIRFAKDLLLIWLFSSGSSTWFALVISE